MIGRWALGPFGYPLLPAVLLLLAIFFLTIVTQIGGLVLWLALPLLRLVYRRGRRAIPWLGPPAAVAVFATVYCGVTFLLVPPIAGQFGREALPCRGSSVRPYQALNPLSCLTNRNYAVPAVHQLMDRLSTAVAAEYDDSRISYLDAGFPFLEGFPLLPHLSHHDGRKLDIAFFYRKFASGRPVAAGAPSPIGYWAYAAPKGSEPQPCVGASSWLRWNFGWMQSYFSDWDIDLERTKALLEWLEQEGPEFGVGKVFVEPHLQQRMGLSSRVVRFQGCGAARHDDHIHIAIE
jgi:hypothetical protein